MTSVDPTFNDDGAGSAINLVHGLMAGSSNALLVEGVRAQFKLELMPNDEGYVGIYFVQGTATPQGNSTYNPFPIGTIYQDLVTGDLYIKDAAGDNWGKVTIVT